MKLHKIYSSPTGLCDIFQGDQGQLYLVALCAGIAWSRVGVVMTPLEIESFHERPAFAEELGLRLCKNFEQYRARAIPDSVRDVIIAQDD